MPAPIPIPPSSIHSSRMAFSGRWRMPARSAAAPAGRRAISCSRTRQARIVGCAPCYLKSHSQGEYVFDHCLGRRLRPGGRQLLSQAADRRAVHAGARAAPAGAARAGRRRAARRCWRREPATLVERNQLSGVHVTFLSEGEWDRLGEPRLPQAHRPAVPLEQCGLRHLRGFPGLARLAQAQGGAQGARARR